VVYTPLNQDDTFFMNVKDSTSIGIQEGIPYLIFHFFYNSIQVLLCSLNHVYPVLLIVAHYRFYLLFPFSFSFLFLFVPFLISFSWCFHLNVHSYKVATTVYLCILCNKLLILKIKKIKKAYHDR